jgi:hypothetical protein
MPPRLIMISWEPAGPDGDPAADAAPLGPGAAVHLHAWGSDGPLQGIRYPVAITVKANTSMVSAVLASMGDFARAISGLMDGALDPCEISAVVGYGWAGSTLGSVVKRWLGVPLISSVGDSSPAGADLQSAAIRGLEMRSVHGSDLVVARSRPALMRVRYEHGVPLDRTLLAESPEEMASVLAGYLAGGRR